MVRKTSIKMKRTILYSQENWQRSIQTQDFRWKRSEEHTSELQSQSNLVCRLLLEKKKKKTNSSHNYLRLHKCYRHTMPIITYLLPAHSLTTIDTSSTTLTLNTVSRTRDSPMYVA